MLFLMNHYLRSRGQTVVLVAFSLIVVLLFAGLAIDGSNAYQQRRRMQNAADAGALAGARQLAVSTNRDSTDNNSVLSAVNTYATSNGAPSGSISAFWVSSTSRLSKIVSNGSIPSDAVGVQAYAENNFILFFRGFIGVNQKKASAEAVAKGGVANSIDGGSGAFPVGFPESEMDSLQPGDTVDIWTDESITVNGSPRASTTGWLNFNYIYNNAIDENDSNNRWDTTCPCTPCSGSNAVKCYVDHNYQHPIYAGAIMGKDGDFLDSKSGVTASILHDITTPRTVVIPLYDVVDSWQVMHNDPDLDEPPGGFQGQGPYFHIVGFASFVITEVKSHGSDKAISGQFISRVVSGSMASSTSGVSNSQFASTVISLAEVNTSILAPSH